ncbi:hypothetical protein Q3C19_17255 [Bacteroides sp. ET489]|uniref:hypothetical protein n=1 Tax=Bacteroides TaxID=816 RepID=UPI00135656FC|nr:MULTISPECIES: hypothetical protein [Bacteroides]MDO3392204.1 hypothetical protein [Bacteroides sp. ET489]
MNLRFGCSLVLVLVLSTRQDVKISQKGKSIRLEGISPVADDLTVIAVVLDSNVRD